MCIIGKNLKRERAVKYPHTYRFYVSSGKGNTGGHVGNHCPPSQGGKFFAWLIMAYAVQQSWRKNKMPQAVYKYIYVFFWEGASIRIYFHNRNSCFASLLHDT